MSHVYFGVNLQGAYRVARWRHLNRSMPESQLSVVGQDEFHEVLGDRER
jgi:hypothetical protein